MISSPNSEHFSLAAPSISRSKSQVTLFRKTPLETLISAPGTSCRHQIKDVAGRKALHPVEILHQALKG